MDHTAYHTIGYGYQDVQRLRVTRCTSLDNLFSSAHLPRSPNKDAAPAGPSSADFKRKKYLTLLTPGGVGDKSLSDDELDTSAEEEGDDEGGESSELTIPPVTSCTHLCDVIRYHSCEAHNEKMKEEKVMFTLNKRTSLLVFRMSKISEP